MLLEPLIIISSTYCTWLWCCSDYLRWAYETGSKDIYICEQVKDKKNVLYHELWHYIYFEKLNDKQRAIIDSKYTQEEWARVFQKWLAKDPKKLKKYFKFDYFKTN